MEKQYKTKSIKSFMNIINFSEKKINEIEGTQEYPNLQVMDASKSMAT